MDTYQSSMAPRFAAELERIGARLRHVLAQQAHGTEGSGEAVRDFKDVAAEEADTQVGDIQADHAARDLERVGAALQRIAAGTYGPCVECGEAIDLRRLQAVPMAERCTRCQAGEEAQRTR